MSTQLMEMLANILRARIVRDADALLTQQAPFPVVELKIPLNTSRNKEIIYDGGQGVGMFIQTLDARNTSSGHKIVLTLNRPDGPFYNPRDEEIYIGEPIRRLYISNTGLGWGDISLRIHTNPLYSLVALPSLRVMDVMVRDRFGGYLDAATETTLEDVKSFLRGIVAFSNPSNGSPEHGQVQLEANVTTQFPSVIVPSGKAVIIHASPDNTHNVYIGGSAVSQTNGYILGPGEDLPPIYIANLNVLYGRAHSSASVKQAVCYIVEKPLLGT